MLLTLTQIEIEKLFRRGRTYIGIIAIVLIVIVIQGGMILSGQALIDFISNTLQDYFILQGNLLNGYLIAYFSINALWIHVPVLIVIVTGDLISGEASSGTFRIYLTRPISRQKVLLAKFIAGMVYALLLVVLLALFSLATGILVFGTGDIIVYIDTINVLPENELPFRFLLSFGYAILSMWMVAALSFVFSSFSDNSLAPILYSMGLIILFTVISTFEAGIFISVKPYLFTTYLNNWQAFFEYELDWIKIGNSIGIIIIHIIALLTLSIVLFKRRDITT